jgi:hypothetical protein
MARTNDALSVEDVLAASGGMQGLKDVLFTVVLVQALDCESGVSRSTLSRICPRRRGLHGATGAPSGRHPVRLHPARCGQGQGSEEPAGCVQGGRGGDRPAG